MSTRVAELANGRDAAVLPALFQLTKPGITRLVLVTMLAGALAAPGAVDFVRLATALLATAIVVGGANALNMYWERDTDALMARTRARPLPSGRITPELALWFGVGSSLFGLVLLSAFVNPLSAGLAALALVSYVLVYTPLKRVTPWSLYVGAVPGAIPPLIGWAASTGSLARPAWLLFLVLLFWQLPHFVAIAIFRREEYERARIPVLPLVRGLRGAKHALARYSGLLFFVSLLPVITGDASAVYAALAAAAGAFFLALSLHGLKPQADRRWARATFFASMPYLVLLFAALVVDVRL
ncbi:MAG TPA: heme o synthase [Polyangiaceae bacterium]|jgi:protoheme IX farnesyltransferase